MKKVYYYLLVATFLFSCSKGGNELNGNVEFSRENFKETKELLNPEEITIDDLLYPASFRVMDDSVLVVCNQPMCEYLLELYSLNTLKPIKRLITKGNGPGEMLSAALGLNTNRNVPFYIQDSNTSQCYIVDMKSLYGNSTFTPLNKFKYSSEILNTTDICLLGDERYVAYHMWFLDDKSFSTVDSPLAYYAYNDNSNKGYNDFPYFVASVNGARLFVNPKTKHVWSVDLHRDVINVYNDSLKQIASIKGPDNLKPSYTKLPINAPVAFVGFENGKSYASYVDYYLTDKHAYLVYQGTSQFNPNDLSPVEIFKLDFDGNFLCNYKVDRYVYSISVDNKEEYLYCASRVSMAEPPVILKYKL